VRSGELGDAMPDNLRKIEVFDFLAINVDLKFAGELGDPFDYNALGSVTLVEERRNDRQPRFLLALIHASTLAFALFHTWKAVTQ